MSDAFGAPPEDAGSLRQAGHCLDRVSTEVAEDRSGVARTTQDAIGHWTGPRNADFDRAAGGIQVRLRVVEDAAADAAAALSQYARVVEDADDELAELRAGWRAADAPLPDGSPRDPVGLARTRAPLEAAAHDVRTRLARVAGQVADRLDAATGRLVPGPAALSPEEIRRQVHASQPVRLPAHPTTCQALAALAGVQRAVPEKAVRPDGSVDWTLALEPARIPTKRVGPLGVALWWLSLSSTQQADLLRDHPGRIGNLDGVPAHERDLANRAVLPQALRGLRRDLAALPPPPPEWVRAGYTTVRNKAYSDWKAEHDDLEQKIHGTEEIQRRLRNPGYLLLALKPRAGHGQAVLSLGDPDLADHTAVFVTGTGTHLGGIAEDLDRSEAMARAAGAHTDGSIAAVTWYGYDAPRDLPHAALLHYAEDGAPRLDGFVDGLRETHQGTASHVTVVGHSYGTTTVGWAASHGHHLDADDVVLVASPGAGVGHGWIEADQTTVEALHLRGESRGHVYATRSKADWIKIAVDTHLGVDPTEPAFGATRIGATPSGDHSSYWDAGNPSLTGLGQVIAGTPVSPPKASDDLHAHPSLHQLAGGL